MGSFFSQKVQSFMSCVRADVKEAKCPLIIRAQNVRFIHFITPILLCSVKVAAKHKKFFTFQAETSEI